MHTQANIIMSEYLPMESFDIDKLFERAAAKTKSQCRAWEKRDCSPGPLKRCNNMILQHDHVCLAHKDYYKGWWKRHVPNSASMEEIILCDNAVEMRFQIENGYVSLSDFELERELHWNPQHRRFFIFLCSYGKFNPYAHHLSIQCAVDRSFRDIITDQESYSEAYEDLHKYIDKDWIFDIYLQNLVSWIKGNIHDISYPEEIFDRMLRQANISYAHVAGQCDDLASHLSDLRKPDRDDDEDDEDSYYDDEDDEDCDYDDNYDDLYDTCKNLFWGFIYDLKADAKARYEPLRSEVLAAAWAPERMPFWCLDVEEVAEEHPEGLPSKEEWKALCSAAEIKV